MYRSPDELLTKRCLLLLACLAMLLVGLGLSRSLRICTQPCCAGHVKLAASCDLAAAGAARSTAATTCGCCGHHAHSAAASEEGERSCAGSGCCGCHHVALGVDLGLPPIACSPNVPPAAVAVTAATVPATRTGQPSITAHPPATGPPRCDHRTALLATTILRL